MDAPWATEGLAHVTDMSPLVTSADVVPGMPAVLQACSLSVWESARLSSLLRAGFI